MYKKKNTVSYVSYIVQSMTVLSQARVIGKVRIWSWYLGVSGGTGGGLSNMVDKQRYKRGCGAARGGATRSRFMHPAVGNIR